MTGAEIAKSFATATPSELTDMRNYARLEQTRIKNAIESGEIPGRLEQAKSA